MTDPCSGSDQGHRASLRVVRVSAAPKQGPRAGVAFKGVLLDWRGTLVVAPTYRWLVQTALGLLDRDTSPRSVDAVLAVLTGQVGQASDGRAASGGGVGSVMVVLVQPGRECLSAC